jgi:hypothetical protein
MQAQRACIGIAEEGFVTGFACVLGAGLLLRTALMRELRFAFRQTQARSSLSSD